MNYLAHIYLSGDDEQLKIGNFIADSVKGKELLSFPGQIQKGIVLHREIDSYTDSHPTVTRSVTRLFPKYSHYSRVIVDILYDHFLAANWTDYSDVPLDKYVADFYKLLHENREVLPKQVKKFLPYMVQDNWLLNYASVKGIGRILSQMNRRTGNKSKMNLATEELEMYYPEFENEFRAFFEDLREFSLEKRKQL